MQVNYAEIVTVKPVQKFLHKFYISNIPIQSLIIISPFVGTLECIWPTLDDILKKANDREIPMYIITRPPEDIHHKEAIEAILKYDSIELRFNKSLHAKLYVCICQEESQSFALLGSANLTLTSVTKNIEIAMMIYGRGRGRDILRELSRWGLERVRTLNETKLIKKIVYKRRV